MGDLGLQLYKSANPSGEGNAENLHMSSVPAAPLSFQCTGCLRAGFKQTWIL